MLISQITIDDVEQWNDCLAREHDIDDYYERSGFAVRYVEGRRLAIIRRMISARPDDSILEVGCGGGHVLGLFPDSTLTGTDVSGLFLAKARKNLLGYRARLLKGELDDLQLPEASFTKAICTEVLEHVVDPESMLKHLQRLVQPGGTVVITFPNDRLINRIKGIIHWSGASLLPPFRRISWGADTYHLHVWRYGQMRSLLSRFFTIREVAFAPFFALPLRCCFRCLNNIGGG